MVHLHAVMRLDAAHEDPAVVEAPPVPFTADLLAGTCFTLGQNNSRPPFAPHRRHDVVDLHHPAISRSLPLFWP